MTKKIILSVLPVFFLSLTSSGKITKPARLYFLGMPDKALKAYLTETKKNPSPDVYLNAAFTATELAKIADTFKILKDGTEKYPQNDDLKRELALVFMSRQDYKNARKIYLKLIEKDNTIDYLNLARIELGTGNYLLAENYLNRTLLLDKTVYLSYFFLGQAYEASGKPYYAIKAYEKLLSYDNQFLSAKKHLAKLYLERGNPKTSYDYYKSIAYALPKNNEISRQLERTKEKLATPPEEIILPKGKITYRKIEKFKINPQIPFIKIGLCTSSNGLAVKTDEFYFSASCGFWVKKSDDTKIISGGPGKVWSVKYNEQEKTATLFNDFEKPVFDFNSSVKIVLPPMEKCTTILHSALFDHATSSAQRADREYRGNMEFFVDNETKTLLAVNHINLEEYLYSVLPSEMPDFYPPEALKAQAILARTYVLRTMKKNSYFDLCDSQKCQVYKGTENETSHTAQAINNTQGIILTYDNKPVYAVFSSNCGGISQSSKSAWGFEFDYLKSRLDYKNNNITYSPYTFKKLFQSCPVSYCEPSEYVNSKNYRWGVYVTAEDIAEKISNKKSIGKIKAILVLKRTISGHIQKILIKATKGDFLLDSESKIKYYLSFDRLKSTAFIIEPYYNGKYLDSVMIYGAGWGHAVGMCQSGASGRADAGHDYRQILGHYFPNTKLKSLVE